MPALIGISGDTDERTYRINRDYVQAVALAGGAPVVLPPIKPELTSTYLDKLDGLLLSGGPDIDPQHFAHLPSPALGAIDPERDAFELKLAREAYERGLPILAICRGIQVLAVALGGSLIQDIASEWQGAMQHRQNAPRSHPFHAVTITPDSKLASIVGAREIRVNSFHHQALMAAPQNFTVTASAADGVIEAFEDPAMPFCVGVQWHPEGLSSGGDAFSQKLFSALVQAARKEVLHV